MSDVEAVRERLAQMRALCEAATPGPWEIKDMGDSTFTSDNGKGWWWVWKAGVRHYAGVMEATGDSPDKSIGVAGITDNADGVQELADATFIAAASPDMMLRLVTEAEGVLDRHGLEGLTCSACELGWPCRDVEAVLRAWAP